MEQGRRTSGLNLARCQFSGLTGENQEEQKKGYNFDVDVRGLSPSLAMSRLLDPGFMIDVN